MVLYSSQFKPAPRHIRGESDWHVTCFLDVLLYRALVKNLILIFLPCFISQQPAQCCVVAMGSTPKDAACVTVAGRAPSVMCLQRSASILSVGVGAFASWALVPATLDTKEKTVKKVNE